MYFLSNFSSWGEDGRPLAAIAREAKLSYGTLQYWLERYQTSAWPRLRVSRGRTDYGPKVRPDHS